jgi:hypothetical protein
MGSCVSSTVSSHTKDDKQQLIVQNQPSIHLVTLSHPKMSSSPNHSNGKLGSSTKINVSNKPTNGMIGIDNEEQTNAKQSVTPYPYHHHLQTTLPRDNNNNTNYGSIGGNNGMNNNGDNNSGYRKQVRQPSGSGSQVVPTSPYHSLQVHTLYLSIIDNDMISIARHSIVACGMAWSGVGLS